MSSSFLQFDLRSCCVLHDMGAIHISGRMCPLSLRPDELLRTATTPVRVPLLSHAFRSNTRHVVGLCARTHRLHAAMAHARYTSHVYTVQIQ